MSTYKTPGVYVEEITKLPPSVAAVETAIPAFVGYTEKAVGAENVSLLNKPTRITSMLEYEQYFGGPRPEAFKVVLNEPGAGELTRTATVTAPTTGYLNNVMYYQIQLFFANGGGPCYIVSVGGYNDGFEMDSISDGFMGTLNPFDEPTLIVYETPVGTSSGVLASLAQNALAACASLKDRFAIVDSGNDVAAFRTSVGNDNLKYGAAYYPNLNTSLQAHYDKEDLTIFAHNGAGGGIPDPEGDPGGPQGGGITSLAGKKLSEIDRPTRELIETQLKKFRVGNLPPSFAVAGVYARVDSERGVWKAPANVSLLNISSLTVKVDDNSQAGLNIDPVAGKSINAIRAFTGKGILVWGARTLAGNDAEWRYVPVRRLFTFVEESCKKSTSWAVFEPNDAGTWITVKSQIENFLNNLWREGALMGSKPEQAYYVKVGLNQTMTQQEVLDGYLNVEIGMAAVRPAEFIVLKFSHLLPQS